MIWPRGRAKHSDGVWDCNILTYRTYDNKIEVDRRIMEEGLNVDRYLEADHEYRLSLPNPEILHIASACP